MSKDVVIAGLIVTACLGLVAVAFLGTKKKPIESTGTDLATTTDPLSTPTPPSINDLPPISDPGSPLANNTNPLNPPGSTFGNPPGSTFGNPPGSTFGNPPGGTFGNPPGSTFGNPPGFPQPPAPPAQPLIETPPLSTEPKSHTVAAGETLGEISMKHYGTSKHWKKIAEANKVDAADLKVGQKLTIPVVEKPAPPAGTVADTGAAPQLAGGERTYKIKRDDSYYSIAKRELGSANRWKEIEKLNGIPSEELRVGQTIKLPPKKDEAVTPAPLGEPGAPAVEGNVHVVVAGETLGDISKKHYGTTTKWKEIVKANPGVDPEGLKVGQKLKLPEIANTTPAPTAPGAPAGEGSADDYTVKAGDTLESIALSQLGSKTAWKKIVDANPGLDARKLRIGQKLRIPGKTAAPAADPLPIGGGNPTGSGFGSGSGSGFGSGSGSSGFGGGSSGFGPSTPPPAGSGFGTSPPPAGSGFGTPPPPAGSGFGTPAPSYPAPPAGSPSGSTGFGTPAPSTGFGTPAPSTGFGSGGGSSGFGSGGGTGFGTPAASGSTPLSP